MYCTHFKFLFSNKSSYFQTSSRGPRLSNEIVNVFSKSINDGNHSYGKLLKSRHLENMNLSIPEALDALGNLITDVEEWVMLVIFFFSFITNFFH